MIPGIFLVLLILAVSLVMIPGLLFLAIRAGQWLVAPAKNPWLAFCVGGLVGILILVLQVNLK
jgi:hypothetical protein